MNSSAVILSEARAPSAAASLFQGVLPGTIRLIWARFAPGLLIAPLLLVTPTGAQTAVPTKSAQHRATRITPILLHESSRHIIASETGGAFMSGSKCDSEGNLYIRKLATDRPMLGPVVKINEEGKRVAMFDPASFSDPKLSRADAFSPALDGGLYQIAGTGGLKPQIYVIRFAADGSPASATRIDAEFEPYQFAAFPAGNLLVSGLERDVMNKSDQGRNFTAVFSDDGRMLARLSLTPSVNKTRAKAGKRKTEDTSDSKPTLDLSEADPGMDGNIYALRRSDPAVVYVISSAGKLVRTLKVKAPEPGVDPSAFHVSGNRMAVAFSNDEKQSQTVVIVDAQTGRAIAHYSDQSSLGPAFACYSADEGVFTFLQLGEQNTIEVVRANAD